MGTHECQLRRRNLEIMNGKRTYKHEAPERQRVDSACSSFTRWRFVLVSVPRRGPTCQPRAERDAALAVRAPPWGCSGPNKTKSLGANAEDRPYAQRLGGENH